jgi:hypothetical protein
MFTVLIHSQYKLPMSPEPLSSYGMDLFRDAWDVGKTKGVGLTLRSGFTNGAGCTSYRVLYNLVIIFCVYVISNDKIIDHVTTLKKVSPLKDESRKFSGILFCVCCIKR